MISECETLRGALQSTIINPLLEASMFHILLVEDDRHFRTILKQELNQWFPSVLIEEASDSREAMEKMDSFSPQLIFMDVRLPNESGLELTKKIKAKHPTSDIVMLTSHDLPEYRQAATECGAAHFFVKGTSDGIEIRSLVESLLKG
jgi:DNA-binding NarL/FixJ family response regulator